MNLDRRGLIGTIAFHILILTLFILFGFTTPLPLPEEAGILINFGDADLGSGIEEPSYNQEPVPQPVEEVPEEVVEEVSDESPIMTQEIEEAPAVAVVKKPEKKPEKKKDPVIKETPKPVQTQPKVEEKPKVDPRAMYSGRKNNTTYKGSQGNTEGAGNQGSISGDVDATNYGLGGGSGNTPGAYLEGRNAISLPIPVNESQKEGKVVVQIKVDRQGNVVEAVPGIKGSTIMDSYLNNLARKAALRSKFDSKADAQFYQTGTITYIFRVK